jgi:hypothetical protein
VHKLAYGTDKASAEVDEEGSAWDADAKNAPPVRGLHDRLARLEANGLSADELKAIQADIEALETKLAGHGAA